MPFKTRWLVENKIILTDFIGDISINELKDSSMQVMQMLEQSDSPQIHLLTDETALGSLPSSIKQMSESSPFMKHPQMGWMVMYGSKDRMAKLKAIMVTSKAQTQFRRFMTLQESLEFLVAEDESLPTIEEILDQ